MISKHEREPGCRPVKKSTVIRKKAARPTKPVGRNPVIAGRVPEPLYEKIKAAAAASGRSMSEELAWRVEQAFNTDEVLGGPEMRNIAALMIGAFNAAGAAADSADGYVSAEGEYNWRRDQFCYLHAAMAVVEALLVATPKGPLTPDQISLEVDVLTKRLKERLTNQWESFAAARKAAGRVDEGGGGE